MILGWGGVRGWKDCWSAIKGSQVSCSLDYRVQAVEAEEIFFPPLGILRSLSFFLFSR